MFCIVALAIVPLSMSKTTNRGKIDILSFVLLQGSRTRASKRKILTAICIALNTGIAGSYLFCKFLAIFPLSPFFIEYFGYVGSFFKHLHLPIDSPRAMTSFGLAAAIVLGIAVLRCFLYHKNQTSYPLCLSLGGVANADYEPQSDENDDTNL